MVESKDWLNICIPKDIDEFTASYTAAGGSETADEVFNFVHGARYFVEHNTGFMFGPLFDDMDKASTPIKISIFMSVLYSCGFLYLMSFIDTEKMVMAGVVGVHIFLVIFTILEAFIVYGTI